MLWQMHACYAGEVQSLFSITRTPLSGSLRAAREARTLFRPRNRLVQPLNRAAVHEVSVAKRSI